MATVISMVQLHRVRAYDTCWLNQLPKRKLLAKGLGLSVGTYVKFCSNFHR